MMLNLLTNQKTYPTKLTPSPSLCPFTFRSRLCIMNLLAYITFERFNV
jgi:hypothetical protein